MTISEFVGSLKEEYKRHGRWDEELDRKFKKMLRDFSIENRTKLDIQVLRAIRELPAGASQQAIADEIGVARETITRVLKRLENKKVITREKKEVLIKYVDPSHRFPNSSLKPKYMVRNIYYE